MDRPEDNSDHTFTIQGFGVISPISRQQWVAGTSQTITWETVGSYPTVKVELSTDNGSTWTTITSGTTNTGSYTWTVPGLASSQCLIKVSDSADGFPSDTSDAVFSIVPFRCVTVTSPNGGESWEVGSVHNITWTSTGTVGNVMIDYSTNNGSTWTSITASTANDGTYPWTVPNDALDDVPGAGERDRR